MLYNIIINQKAIIDNELNVTANHIAVMEVVANFILSENAKSLRDNLGDWYWVSYELILDQIPMFDIKKSRCRQLVKELCIENLLEANPNNQRLGRVYLRVGAAYSKYKNFDNPLSKNYQPPCQNFDNPLAKKLATPCQKIDNDNNINHNYTNNNRIKDNNLCVDNFSEINNLPEKRKKVAQKKERLEADAKEVLRVLNELKPSAKPFQETKTNLNFITARLKESGNDVELLTKIIQLKVWQWKDNAKMKMYLRPETLFNATKFQTYTIELEEAIKNPTQYAAEYRNNKSDNIRNKPNDQSSIQALDEQLDNALG